MKITLFSRNTLQNDLFLGVSEELEKSEFQTDILMPGKGESKNNIIFPEVEISDIAGSIISTYQKDFTRLCLTYENLNRIIYSERELSYFPRYFGDKAVAPDSKVLLCTAAFIYFEQYIEKNKPKLIVSEMVTGMLDGAFKEVANRNRIKYIGIRNSKITPGVVLCDNEYDIPFGINKIKEDLNTVDIVNLRSMTNQIVSKHILNNKKPFYMSQSSKPFKVFSFGVFRSILKLINKPANRTKYSIYQRNKFLNPIREKIIKWVNHQHKFYKDVDLSSIGKFFVYAAHFEPESSVSVRAYIFSDQLALVKLISRLIPPDTLLLVKEHKGNRGFRKKEFYEDISHLHNVLLVKPEISLVEIVTKSKGVITLTGRVGLEALLLDIPVISFGKTFWNKCHGVYNVDSIYNLKDYLLCLSQQPNSPVVDKSSIYKLIQAYDRCVYEGTFIHGAPDFCIKSNHINLARAICDIYHKIFHVAKK